MSPLRIIGFILVVVGTVLLVNVYQATQSLLEQGSRAVTGRYTERTTREMYIGGGVVAGGLLLIAVGGGRKRR
jgi:uncharacterized membrane protein